MYRMTQSQAVVLYPASRKFQLLNGIDAPPESCEVVSADATAEKPCRLLHKQSDKVESTQNCVIRDNEL